MKWRKKEGGKGNLSGKEFSINFVKDIFLRTFASDKVVCHELFF